MATNKLKKTLIEEGINQTELSRKAELSIGTINKVCNQKRDCAPTTRSKIVLGINKLSDNIYKVEDIFPG